MLNEKNLNLLKEGFNIELDDYLVKRLNNWYEIFVNYNSHTNLMSKGDMDKIFEKHVFDSLGILKWDEFDPSVPQKILDVGTGGGFPSVILALVFPKLEILANDSRIKKINFIIEAKDILDINNLKISYARVEDLEPLECDIVTSRAVGTIQNVLRLSKKHIKSGGHFVIYKSKGLDEELSEFSDYPVKTYSYNLPLEEHFERKVAVIKL